MVRARYLLEIAKDGICPGAGILMVERVTGSGSVKIGYLRRVAPSVDGAAGCAGRTVPAP